MAKLGSFGAAAKELHPDAEKDTFDFFGEEFAVEGVIPSILLVQVGAARAGQLDPGEADAAVWQAFKCALGSQFTQFHRLAVQHNEELDDLVQLMWTIAGAQAGKATEQTPPSPDGSPPTSTSSRSSASDSPDSGLRSVEDRLLG